MKYVFILHLFGIVDVNIFFYKLDQKVKFDLVQNQNNLHVGMEGLDN